ncbi:ADP-ribosylhydrolase ARH3-like [Euwallacea similis]|uniref:ADP-ribosylhydrolase ARH3-like n=1 Tax=Euwallacea similis TaxID=1736056 RepID=UPI00344DCC8E
MTHIFRTLNLKMSADTARKKFRGCLLGSLMGDCLGAPFEGQEISSGDKIIIQRYFDKMENPNFKSPFKKYTDDTAMMLSIVKYLLDKPDPEHEDSLRHLARLFVNSFFQEPNRGYGQNVVVVFDKLKNTKYTDIFKPAKDQFNGNGSYGNGSAMRIAPIPLLFCNDERMTNIVVRTSKITHSNALAINGALLQSAAICEAFVADSVLDRDKYIDSLLTRIKDIESSADDDKDLEDQTPFYEKMKVVRKLLNREHSNDLDDEVIYSLGNGISAYESVPTAIYCFLRALHVIPKINTKNPFRRTLQYAITLGGDTDTIACMAGAIAGAYYGEDVINKAIMKHCEKYEEVISLADQLYENYVKMA